MSQWRQGFILVLCFFYFVTHCAFADAAESAFWKERRAFIDAQRSSPEPVVLASLPSPASLLEHPSSVLTTPSSTDFLHIPAHQTGSVVERLSSVLLPYGSVRDASFLGGDHPRIVFHIQDVHLNFEAQENIRETLQRLIDSGEVDVVALEGAFGPVNLSGFRGFSR